MCKSNQGGWEVWAVRGSVDQMLQMQIQAKSGRAKSHAREIVQMIMKEVTLIYSPNLIPHKLLFSFAYYTVRWVTSFHLALGINVLFSNS